MEESYIEIEICCPTFAGLCEKLNIFDGEDDSIYMLFEDVGYRDRNATPGKYSVAEYIAELMKSHGMKKQAAEIEKYSAEIDKDIKSAEIEYKIRDRDDNNSNIIVRETHTETEVTTSFMNSWVWDELWENKDHSEFEKLMDDPSDDIESLSPENYPFWLFMAEGWDIPDENHQFFCKMIDKYSDVKVYSVSRDPKAALKNLQREQEELIAELNKRYVNPKDYDFNGKRFSVAAYAFDPVSKRCMETDRLSVKMQEALEKIGASSTMSYSSKTDCVIILHSADDVRHYNPDNHNPEEVELEKNEKFTQSLKDFKEGLAGDDLRRVNSKKNPKPPIQIMWEDEFYEFIADKLGD